MFASSALAQRTVGGVVSDDSGELLPGASVVIKGTTRGVITDIDGNYSISVPDASSVLIFSFVGMETQEIVVGNQTTINVTMISSSIGLDDVVVTALGMTRQKKSLGYSVGEVEGEALTTVAQENVINSLAGRVSGVQINQTSGDGSSTSIVIRGASSLTSDNQPLFVIDGVPVQNSLNNVMEMGDRNKVDYGNAISDLNPEDVESMTVLKGPSAAALYGSRAGNGVIIVTTKAGRRTKGVGVTFSTNTVFETPYKYLDFHYRYGAGELNAQLDESSAYWGGPELDVGNTAVQWNSPVDASGNKTATPLVSYEDNMKNFLQTGITSTNNLAFQGATDKSTYRISYTNMSNRGTIPNSNLKRNTLSLNGTYKILDDLKLSTNINITRSQSDDRPATINRGANALQAVYAFSHVDIRELKDYWEFEDVQQRQVSNEADNPWFIAYGITNAFFRNRLYGNIRLDWDITPDITAYARFMHDRLNEQRETSIPKSYRRQPNGGYSLFDLYSQESNADFLVTWVKDIPDWNFSVSAGGNYRYAQAGNFLNQDQGKAGIVVPGLYRVQNIASSGLNYENYSEEKTVYSVFGLATVSWRDYLFLDLTARNDWSSTLPEDNRSYFYPSASLSWIIGNTWELPEIISLAKLRGGWARVGNDTDPYNLVNTLNTNSWGTLVTTTVPAGLKNPDLKPEMATSIEVGLDFNMFDNRLRLDMTYYTVDNENQIINIPSTASSGFTGKLINAGLLRSKGWEVSLGGTPIVNDDWKWDIVFNYTRNRTTIEELDEDGVLDRFQLWGDNGGGAITFLGDEIGDLYSRTYATVEDESSQYFGWPIVNSDGDSFEIKGGDPTLVGNFNPDFMLGIQTALTYKNWTLSASFDWRKGGDFMSYTYRYGESDWKSQRQLDYIVQGGLMEPSEVVALLKSDPEKYILPENGRFPRVGGHTPETGGYVWDDGEGNTGNDGAFVPGVYLDDNGDYVENLGDPATTKFIPITWSYPWSYSQAITFDASFFKMRELSIGYQFPKAWLGNAIQSMSLSLYTRNIMIWTQAKVGIDPERAFESEARDEKSGSQFRQGLERQNVMPWTFPIGFKLNMSF
jgi:TonB-linked SusC/RagA family outer membrane protein